jgi:hypothetical protein
MIPVTLAITPVATDVNHNPMALEVMITKVKAKTRTGPVGLVNTAVTTHLTVLLAARVADCKAVMEAMFLDNKAMVRPAAVSKIPLAPISQVEPRAISDAIRQAIKVTMMTATAAAT